MLVMVARWHCMGEEISVGNGSKMALEFRVWSKRSSVSGISEGSGMFAAVPVSL